MRINLWRGVAALPACWLLLATAGAVRAADDKPVLDPKAVDAVVHKTLREVINEGADLYNAQGRYKNMERDYAGCYRLYEGALLVTRPLLAHRPGLQKAIDDGLAAARETPQLPQRAFVLRDVIDKIRAEVNPIPNPPTPTKVLWERLGGEKAVTQIVDDWADAVSKDEKIDATRGGKFLQKEEEVKKLKKQIVDWVSSVSDGPLAYKGLTMKEAHKDMGITNEQFDLTVKHLKEALKKNDVKEEDGDKLVAAVEATRKDIVEGKKEPPKPATLWDKLGGEPAVIKLVDDWIETLAKDEKVNLLRGKGPPSPEEAATRKSTLVDFLSKMTGGPRKYTGKDMKAAHKGMEITNEEYDALVKDLKEALKKDGVKEEPAKELVDLVEGLRKDIVEGKKDPPKEPPGKGATLWERLGGEKGVAQVVDDFVAAVEADKEVNFYRDPKNPPSKERINALKSKLIDYVSSQTGGPRKYDGKDMAEAHKGMAVADKEFTALVKDLEKVLKDNGVKADDVKALVDAVEGKRKNVVQPKAEDKSKPGEGGTVTGKVTFKGQALPGGAIGFVSADGKPTTAKINEDGSYKVGDLKPGEYKVTIETESVKPAKDAKPPEGKDAPKYVPIPVKYRDGETSGLKYEVKKGEQTFDVGLAS
jgi:hemoglobin